MSFYSTIFSSNDDGSIIRSGLFGRFLPVQECYSRQAVVVVVVVVVVAS
jgi:hypothetical protein